MFDGNRLSDEHLADEDGDLISVIFFAAQSFNLQ